MADEAPRLGISQTALRRRIERGIGGSFGFGVKDGRFFIELIWGAVHIPTITHRAPALIRLQPDRSGRTAPQPVELPASRSIARQPMSVRWNPPGQSIFRIAA